MIKISSPNFDKRPKGVEPSIIVLHYTGMGSALEAMEALCDKTAKVSCHYFIDEDGSITQLVKDDKRAWHAGTSFWNGLTDVNAHSIGIELVNPGHEYGYRPFTENQTLAVIEVCQDLIQKYNIPAYNIVGHSDVAPERKNDPGELFDWKRLAANGIGLWPEPTKADFAEAEEIIRNDYALQHMLQDYGYSPLAAYVDLVTAYHRHFCPEKFNAGEKPDEADKTSAASLIALLRLRAAVKAPPIE